VVPIQLTRQGVSVHRTLVVRPEAIGSAHLSQAPMRRGDSKRTGANNNPATATFASGTMLTLRSSSWRGIWISRTVSRISTICAAPVSGWVSILRRKAQS